MKPLTLFFPLLLIFSSFVWGQIPADSSVVLHQRWNNKDATWTDSLRETSLKWFFSTDTMYVLRKERWDEQERKWRLQALDSTHLYVWDTLRITFFFNWEKSSSEGPDYLFQLRETQRTTQDGRIRTNVFEAYDPESKTWFQSDSSITEYDSAGRDIRCYKEQQFQGDNSIYSTEILHQYEGSWLQELKEISGSTNPRSYRERITRYNINGCETQVVQYLQEPFVDTMPIRVDSIHYLYLEADCQNYESFTYEFDGISQSPNLTEYRRSERAFDGEETLVYFFFGEGVHPDSAYENQYEYTLVKEGDTVIQETKWYQGEVTSGRHTQIERDTLIFHDTAQMASNTRWSERRFEKVGQGGNTVKELETNHRKVETYFTENGHVNYQVGESLSLKDSCKNFSSRFFSTYAYVSPDSSYTIPVYFQGRNYQFACINGDSSTVRDSILRETEYRFDGCGRITSTQHREYIFEQPEDTAKMEPDSFYEEYLSYQSDDREDLDTLIVWIKSDPQLPKMGTRTLWVFPPAEGSVGKCNPLQVSLPDTVKSSLKVYPNPVDKYLWIESEKDLLGGLILQLSSITGQIVWKGKLPYEKKVKISTERMPNGLYFLGYERGGRKFTEKIMVRH